MLDEVRSLLILQDRDRRLLALAKDLDKLPQEEARAKTKLAGDESAVTKAHDALREAELKVKKIEMDAATRRTTIVRLKNQQFETRKNEEFQALGHEITRYEKELDGLETEELEAMEEVDKLRAILATAEAAKKRTQGLVEEDLASIKERHARLAATRDEVRAERAPLAAAIDGTILGLYERLMKTKDGLAVAPMLEGGRCGGCQMKLIPSSVVKVQAGTERAQCENCGRIIYQD
ncbi:MAG TPA: C4-type zinc ribbon domain-containing protein [Luteolibacter sp.]|nr:C4-type zinc ribbon domain-containing protein [Luteolibacter sp.]